jgi:thiamine-monophosphate kinase
MDASELGERALVRRVTRRFASKANALGFADDAAAVPWGEHFLVATVDSLAASTHFPAGMGHEDMGWMAAAASLSDLAAKGAEPLGLLLAMGLPEDLDEALVDAVAEGFARCAEAHGAEVLGGDTKPAGELTLTSAGLGKVPRAELLPRTGIQPGDVLAVTGELGGAGAGLAALQRGLGAELAERLFHPAPRVAEGRALAASRAARACMDVSDGLASSLHQLAAVNRCGFVVEADRLPVHLAAARVAREPGEAAGWALQAGGDYELLVALVPGGAEGARLAVLAAGGRLSFVGRAVPEPGVWVARGPRREPLPDEGWEHFRAPGP